MCDNGGGWAVRLGQSGDIEVTDVTSSTVQGAATILVVDDEPEVRLLLRECLELEGYRVVEAGDGASLKQALATNMIDLVTLDLNLGGEDGLALARDIRTVRNMPIVMISGKSDTIDRVVGLELGADDYISKPFHLREVLARIRAVLRRYELRPADVATGTAVTNDSKPSGHRFAFEGWQLDLNRRDLRTSDGGLIELTTAEFNLLAIFVQRPSRVLSRDDIMDLLKGHDWSPLDRSIDSLVARLRKKIEQDNDAPKLVKTVRGVGYVFAAPVAKC
jgi:two-component system, OmpR family, response regulator